MAWLWASSKPAESASDAASAAVTAATSIPPTPSEPVNAQPKAAAHPDAEYHAAFPHLAPQQSPSSSSTTEQSAASNPAYNPEYPVTMSCRAAFDSAFYCSSLGGHFNSIYRYGELRSCSEHWADWRFCMGLKTRTKADKEALIQERYRQKEEKVKSKPNSEHIWEKIPEGQRHLGAFKPE